MDFITQVLFVAAQLAQHAIPADYEGNPDRCSAMSAESAILDIVQCLESNPNGKKVKRVKRLKFLLKFFGSEISKETLLRLLKLSNTLDDISAEETVGQEPTLAQLMKDVGTKIDDIEDGIVFDKLSPDNKFVPSLKQMFHDQCKSVVNRDGYVYDVFAAIAIISFEELLNSCDVNVSQLRMTLLSRSKLIFKGGAAIGKFLFRCNKKMWDSMIDNDKAFVMENFINKGDNDTGLSFSMPENSGVSVDEINNEIGSILYDMQLIVMENVKRFKVEKIIASYIEDACKSKFEFDERQFSFESRNATSFAITEKNALQNELIPLGSTSGRLFGSVSYLEFADANGAMIKFYLGRVKAAFVAKMKTNKHENPFNLNCYAECLDISASCIDSAQKFKAKYQPARFSDLIREYY